MQTTFQSYNHAKLKYLKINQIAYYKYSSFNKYNKQFWMEW